MMTNSNGEVKVVEWPSWTHAYTMKAHTSSCLSLALAPSGRYLAIGGSDSLISLYDTKDFMCQRTLTTANAGAIKAVSFSFDGSYVVGAWEMDKESQGLTPELAIFHAETGINVHTINPSVPPPRPMERQTDFGVSAVAWHPLRYWLAYSPVSTIATELRIIGMGGSL
jgi:THO complex subunit 3